MIAVSDQGPLHYLILIGCDYVLPQLYERVIAPRVVIEKEMGDPATPEPVRTWAANPPPWLEILEPTEVENISPLSGKGDRGAGEIAAIALARELGTEDLVILMDDKRARREARARGLHPVWTLTMLDEAAERGLIPDITERLEHLEYQTPFRINRECKAAIEGMKQRARERKQAREPTQAPEAQSSPEHRERNGEG